jgi:hypothetical protein
MTTLRVRLNAKGSLGSELPRRCSRFINLQTFIELSRSARHSAALCRSRCARVLQPDDARQQSNGLQSAMMRKQWIYHLLQNCLTATIKSHFKAIRMLLGTSASRISSVVSAGRSRPCKPMQTTVNRDRTMLIRVNDANRSSSAVCKTRASSNSRSTTLV